jgi:hypothetical protein
MESSRFTGASGGVRDELPRLALDANTLVDAVANQVDLRRADGPP